MMIYKTVIVNTNINNANIKPKLVIKKSNGLDVSIVNKSKILNLSIILLSKALLLFCSDNMVDATNTLRISNNQGLYGRAM